VSERDVSGPSFALRTAEQLSVALVGRYAVEKEVGAGGMATVYLARDTRHQRKVALKVLKPDLGAALGPERFLTEIQVTANLQHPNLLPLFDSGEVKDARGPGRSLLFYVMPFVEGQTLRTRLEREGQLPVDEALRIAIAIAGALDYAHRHGVVHRDLKPENILLHEDQPVVTDFGIALAVSNAGGERLTQMGLSLGTPQYMSPEQATGDREIDARSDIYSLGAVLYEMLAGAPPHTGNSLQAIIAKVIVDRPASVRGTRETVPEHVDHAIGRALEKLPADRFATAADFAHALRGQQAIAVRQATVPGVLQLRSTTAIGRVMAHPVAKPVVVGSAWLVMLGAAAALGAAIALTIWKTPPAPYTTFPVMTPDSVTISGTGRTIAISENGARIVVSASMNGREHLYARRTDGEALTRLHGTEGGASPAFSPSGDWLVFASRGRLVKAPADGGATLTLTNDSGDGQQDWGDDDGIIFVRRGALWRVPAAGGTATIVARPDSAGGARGYAWPDVLPGSRRALVTIRRSTGGSPDSNRIGVVSLADGKVIDLGVTGTGARYAAPGHLVYASAGGSLWAIPFNAAKGAVTGDKTQLADGVYVDSTGAADLAVSATGALIYAEHAVSGRVSPTHVALAIVDSTGTMKTKSSQVGHFIAPRVSPDASRIAVEERTGRSGSDVWTYEIAKGALTPMTRDGVYGYPEWLDARQIVFRENSAGPGRFLVQPWDLSAPRQVYYAPRGLGRGGSPAYGLSIGPNGKPAALLRSRTGAFGGNRQDIRVITASGTESTFVETPASEVSPRVSPSGKWVAYASNESGTYQVYVLPVAGGARVPVSVAGGLEPLWSRDGKTLFYVAHGTLLAARIDESGGGFRPAKVDTLFSFADKGFLVRTPPNRGPALGSYDVFPNGDFVVLASGGDADDSRTNIIAALNWQRMLKRP
jgi:eukaryotic-like serine/threonine-protein kinase